METDEKLFVVVAVLTIILAGVLLYLFSIDRKVRKIEKQLENE